MYPKVVIELDDISNINMPHLFSVVISFPYWVIRAVIKLVAVTIFLLLIATRDMISLLPLIYVQTVSNLSVSHTFTSFDINQEDGKYRYVITILYIGYIKYNTP